jgi:signal transduction histidine kinase
VKVAGKLRLSFSVVIALTVIVGVVGIVGMVIINHGSTQMFESQSQPLSDLGMAREYFQRLRVQLREIVISSGDTTALDRIEADLINHERGFITFMEEYARTITRPDSLVLYGEIMTMFAIYQPSMQQIIASARVNAPPVQMMIMMEGLAVPTDFIMDALYYLAYARVVQAAHVNNINNFWFFVFFVMIFVVIAAGVAVAILLSWLISRSIVRPLVEIGKFAEKVAIGEIKMETVKKNAINITTTDEVGSLARILEKSYVDLNKNEQTRHRLAEENTALESLSRMKSEFLANFSHETKTPLTVISVNVQLAAELFEGEGEDAQIRKNALRRAQEAIMRGGHTAENNLWLASMQESRKKMERVDISLLLRRCTEVSRAAVSQNGNELVTKIKENLPHIYGNADNIVQVMNNLLSNANRSTHGGTITVRAELHEKSIIVSVADNGEGIAPKIKETLFERGVSGSGGTGIGLSICKQIVSAHGGKIWAENAQNGGAIIKFDIPILEKD